MTNEQILKKVLKKAIKDGWKLGEVFLERINEESKTYEIHSPEFWWWIFDHDFAKAFWGDAVKNRKVKTDVCGVKHEYEVYEADWQYHLQQMVLEKELLKYLEKFLCPTKK